MDKIKRNERLSAIARVLADAPNRIHTLGEFCELFDAAKSTVSEDIDLVAEAFRRFDLGTLETVAGAAGGARFRPTVSRERAAQALAALARRLEEPGRMLPGGFLYTSDVTSEPDTAQLIGEILAQQYYDRQPDLVLTMETKGIPIALMTARALGVPLVIARRDSRAYEGSAVKINYGGGGDRRTSRPAGVDYRRLYEGRRHLAGHGGYDARIPGRGCRRGRDDCHPRAGAEAGGGRAVAFDPGKVRQGARRGRGAPGRRIRAVKYQGLPARAPTGGLYGLSRLACCRRLA